MVECWSDRFSIRPSSSDQPAEPLLIFLDLDRTVKETNPEKQQREALALLLVEVRSPSQNTCWLDMQKPIESVGSR